MRLTESVLKDDNQDVESDNLLLVQKELNTAIDNVINKYTLTELLEMKQAAGNDYVI